MKSLAYYLGCAGPKSVRVIQPAPAVPLQVTPTPIKVREKNKKDSIF